MMKKVLIYTTLTAIFFALPFSASALVPSHELLNTPFETKLFIAIVLAFLSILSFILFAKTDISDIESGLSKLGYMQRVNNCNLYAHAFSEIAKREPFETWENYRDIWFMHPELFHEVPSSVMVELEARFA